MMNCFYFIFKEQERDKLNNEPMNSYQMIKSANIQLNTQMNTIKSYANDNVKINMNAKSFIPRSKRQNHVMINQDNETSNNQNSNN